MAHQLHLPLARSTVCGEPTDREEARKQLSNMNIPFTQQQFENRNLAGVEPL
jgi:hypothetical protein